MPAKVAVAKSICLVLVAMCRHSDFRARAVDDGGIRISFWTGLVIGMGAVCL